MPYNAANATKAITIARVSTDDQEEYSPAAQNARMQAYCQRNNLNILQSHEITESSTKGDRKEFMHIINKAGSTAKKLREPIAIITDKVDRFQRGFKQQPVLEKMRENGLLEYHFSSDNCVIHKNSPAKDLFMWNIAVSLAQNYTDSLRDNVNRAKEQKLANGEWIGQAPIGYINVRDNRYKRHGRGKAEIHLDPHRAPLVKALFEKYATGCYSLSQIAKLSKDIGLTNIRGKQGFLTKKRIHQIITNPFYYGMMRLKTTGEEYPHIYEPVISKALFDQCQDVRLGRNKPHARYGNKQFLFRGLLTCANTGKLCTAQEHKKTYKDGRTQSFTYLVSYNAENPKKIYYTREEQAVQQVEEALESLEFNDENELIDLISYIHKNAADEEQSQQFQTEALKSEKRALKKKQEFLTEMRLDNELTKEEFLEQKHKLQSRQNEIHALMQHCSSNTKDVANKLTLLIEQVSNISELFKGSGLNQKREILSCIFQNLHLDQKNLIYSMASPFDMIAKCNKVEGWCALVDAVRNCKDTRTAILSIDVSCYITQKAA